MSNGILPKPKKGAGVSPSEPSLKPMKRRRPQEDNPFTRKIIKDIVEHGGTVPPPLKQVSPPSSGYTPPPTGSKTVKETIAVVQKDMSPEQSTSKYKQTIGELKRDWDIAHQKRYEYRRNLGEQISTIDPTQIYSYNGRKIAGVYLQQELKKDLIDLKQEEPEFQKQYENIRETYLSALDIPPSSTVTQTKEGGYQIEVRPEDTPEYKAMQRDPISLFATSLTAEDPLGLKSAYYMATGEKSKAIRAKVQSIQTVKSLQTEGLYGFGKFWFSSPITQISLAALIGGGVGHVSLLGKSALLGAGMAKAATAVTLAEVGIGSAFVGMTAVDIYQTSKTDPGGAFARAGLFSFQIGAGITGYKLAQKPYTYRFGLPKIKGVKTRGLSTFERGFHKGFSKRINKMMLKGDITAKQGQQVLWHKNLELYGRAVYGKVETLSWQQRLGIDLGRAETLKGETQVKQFFSKLFRKEKSELFGGVTEKTVTHDIDIAFRNLSKGMRHAKYGVKKLGTDDISLLADIKYYQRTGSLVGRAGTTKQPSFKVDFYKTMRWSESAMRHGESSYELPHVGRAKDINMAALQYSRLHYQAGSPKQMKNWLSEFLKSSLEMEKTPFVMSETESSYLFGGKSFVEKYHGVKGTVYEKVLPSKVQSYFQEKAFKNIMEYSIPTVAKSVTATSSLPPSPSISYFSPFLGVISASVSLIKYPKISYKPTYSISKSIGYYPSSLLSKVESISPRRSYTPVSPSPSVPSPRPSSPSYPSSLSPYPYKSISPIYPSPVSLSLSPSPSSPYYTRTPPSTPVYPKLALFGRGKKYYDEELDLYKYRFRKGETFNPLEEMFKPMKGKTKQRKVKLYG